MQLSDKTSEQMAGASKARVAQWYDFVTERLGREPRGFCDVSAFNDNGQPAVIRVSSVVDGKPFPTLFWLIDAEISLKIDRLEAAVADVRVALQAVDEDLVHARSGDEPVIDAEGIHGAPDVRLGTVGDEPVVEGHRQDSWSDACELEKRVGAVLAAAQEQQAVVAAGPP